MKLNIKWCNQCKAPTWECPHEKCNAVSCACGCPNYPNSPCKKSGFWEESTRQMENLKSVHFYYWLKLLFYKKVYWPIVFFIRRRKK
jgi:hypothetical protein